MLKKISIVIIFLVLSSFSVLASTYRIDENNDGNPEYILYNVDQLRWKVNFATFGSQQGPYTDNSNIPRLTMTNSTDTVVNFTSEDINSFWQIDDSWQKQWYAIWYWNSANFVHQTRYTSSSFTPVVVSPGIYDLEVFSYGNRLSEAVVAFWGQGNCGNVPPSSCSNFCGVDTNDCTHTDWICGPTCNGITIRIYFYNGTNHNIANITNNNWPGLKYTRPNGLVYMTDSTPSYVNVQQTLTICEDECTSESSECNSGAEKWDCQLGGDSCYDKIPTTCDSGYICQLGSCVEQLSDAYWADMSGTPINQTNLSDRVALVVPGSQVEGNTIEYEIWREIPWWWDSKEAQFSYGGFTTWIANETGRYYFKARVLPSNEWIDSSEVGGPYGNLTVTAPAENSPPHAEITGLIDRQIYFLDSVEELNFSQNSYDVDSEFSYQWDLGNGEIREGNSSSWENYNFTYKYATPGQKNIILTVTDEQGLVDTDKVTILIANSSYALAYINTPAHEDDILGYEIVFNSSLSYAVDYDSGTMTMSCLAGDCPGVTQNCPLGHPQEAQLDCGVTVTGTPNDPGFENFNFSWGFDDGASHNASGIAEAGFKKSIWTPGEHWAQLTVYLGPLQGYTFNNFSNSLIRICQIDLGAGRWTWWDQYGDPLDPLINLSACLGEDNVINSPDPNCCPSGYVCNETIPGVEQSAICKVLPECAGIATCDDYLTEAKCLDDTNTCQVSLNQPGTGCGGKIEVDAICGAEDFTSRPESCRCEWNGSSCIHGAGLWGDTYSDNPVIHQCKKATEHGDCIEGLMSLGVVGNMIWNETTINNITENPPTTDPLWIANPNAEAYLNAKCDALVKACGEYKGTSLCGKPLVRLMFFTLRNLIIAVGIIVIIYIILLSRKKGRKRK
jgi:hypothetical protein